MKIILSSSNKDKISEIKEILGDDYSYLTKEEAGFSDLDVEENGSSLEENAFIKAKSIYDLATDAAVFADDTGLFVEALDGNPGVHAARYAGDDATYQDNVEKMLDELKDILDLKKRKAYFETVICFIDPSGQAHYVQGQMHGYIAFEEIGDNGFGYDPIFIPEGQDRTLAQMSTQEKNKISHRANALANFKSYLKENL